MQSFEFCIPTKVIFGEGSIEKTGEAVKEFGKKTLLVSYDETILKSMGILDKIMDSLKKAGVKVFTLYGVKSNPSISHARIGIELIKKEKIDSILGIGGGSAIDEAKAISIGAKYKGDVWDFYSGKTQPTSALPIIAVLTIPATSTETNNISVMSNEEAKRKEGFGSPLMYPKVAILDPEVTYGIPPNYSAYSGADAMSHLLESYLTHEDDFVPFHTRFAEGSLKTIMECTERILKNPKDKDARATIMWTTTWAWNGFSVAGIGNYAIPMHMIEHSLSNFYDVPHGAGMSVCVIGWMKFESKRNGVPRKRIVELAKNIFGIDKGNDDATALAGIKALSDWFDKIGTPTSFAKAKIPSNEIEKLADDAVLTAKAWAMEEYHSRQEIIDILKLCI
jgi:alcohol dehydrogenase YqhD (iron-dependent ADH family)